MVTEVKGRRGEKLSWVTFVFIFHCHAWSNIIQTELIDIRKQSLQKSWVKETQNNKSLKRNKSKKKREKLV